jgi:hypothetical protein
MEGYEMEEACKRLWAAVLNQALEEAIEFNREKFRQNALSWLWSGNQGTGSFLWICDALNLDSKSIRKFFH